MKNKNNDSTLIDINKPNVIYFQVTSTCESSHAISDIVVPTNKLLLILS